MKSFLSFLKDSPQNGKSSGLNLLQNDDIVLKELAIKEKELTIKEQEIKAKIEVDRRNSWISSPLTLAIFGLLSAGIGAALQGYSSFQLESKKIDANAQLERQKFEFSLIQKSLEEKDKKEAAKQLLFLVNSGVIQSLDAEKIRKLAEDPARLPIISSSTNATVSGTPGTKNMHSGAGTAYGVVGTVRTGDRVQILGSSYDRRGYQWYKVYHPQSGTTGWIAAQLINSN